MDHLFSPWRYAYVTRSRSGPGCVLCDLGNSDPSEDASGYVVHRGQHHFILLNIYPYNSGHLMIVPHLHVSRLSDLPAPVLHELSRLAARAEAVLEQVYQAEGINLGMNLGKCAGAGIAEHIHLHAVPRWAADTNFMTVSGETRVLPEDLQETWRKLHGKF